MAGPPVASATCTLVSTGYRSTGGPYTVPSIMIQIVAGDADLPVVWCGVTYKKSTTGLTGGGGQQSNDAHSGDWREVCPQSYSEAQTTSTQQRNAWNITNELDLTKWSAGGFSPTGHVRLKLKGTLTDQASIGITTANSTKCFTHTVPSFSPSANYIKKSDMGILIPYGAACPVGVINTSNGKWFGNHTASGVTYTWSAGTNW